MNAVKSQWADINGFSTELVKRQDKMKEAINASTYEGLQSKVEEALERENDDLRAQNEEMRKLMKEFESSAPVNDMQSPSTQTFRTIRPRATPFETRTNNRFSALSGHRIDKRSEIIDYQTTTVDEPLEQPVTTPRHGLSLDKSKPGILENLWLNISTQKKISKKSVYNRSFPGKTGDQICSAVNTRIIIRTHDLGGQADWVHIYRVLNDKSASKCFENVLKFLFSNTIQTMLLEVYLAYFRKINK